VRRVLASVLLVVGCRHDKPAPVEAGAVDPRPEVLLHVPHVPIGSILFDGETNDPGWLNPPGPVRTGPFLFPTGGIARPYSDARLVWEDSGLDIMLYASDEDIETRTTQPDGPLWLDDAFRVTFTHGNTDYVIDVSPTGVVTDGIRVGGGAVDYKWSSGARVGHDADGTINNASDRDEEWVIELSIPFASIGMTGKRGESIGLSLKRCDTPKHTARICTVWGEGTTRGRLELD
jgi:hypothetical protein